MVLNRANLSALFGYIIVSLSEGLIAKGAGVMSNKMNLSVKLFKAFL